ncbi:hypothetical protein [Nonomuraea sp. NPDC005650]|uniref:hypothetical protein n=1 Tax=Nonomuraea sp. NPDC005650 TaxID=3157045 RepID=UPI0033A55087
MSAPQDAPAAASPEEASGFSRTARRIGCLAFPFVFFALLAAIVTTPFWISDYRLARMVDRVQGYPLPPGAEFGSFDPQVEVSGGDSGDCWYTIRFELSTDRPVQEVLTYYRQARIEDPDGDLDDLSIAAWTLFDEPGGEAAESSDTNVLIIDLDGTYSATLAELRCW